LYRATRAALSWGGMALKTGREIQYKRIPATSKKDVKPKFPLTALILFPSYKKKTKICFILIFLFYFFSFSLLILFSLYKL
jgi:hypothetical protein